MVYIFAPARIIKFSCDLYLKVQSTIPRGNKGCVRRGGMRTREDNDCVRHGSCRRRHRSRRRPHLSTSRHPAHRQWRNNVAFGGNKFKLLPSRVSRNETEVRRRGGPAAASHPSHTLSRCRPARSLALARPHARLRFVIRSRSNDDFSRLSTRRKPVSGRVGRLGYLKYVRQVKRHMTVHTCKPKDEYRAHIILYIYIIHILMLCIYAPLRRNTTLYITTRTRTHTCVSYIHVYATVQYNLFSKVKIFCSDLKWVEFVRSFRLYIIYVYTDTTIVIYHIILLLPI